MASRAAAQRVRINSKTPPTLPGTPRPLPRLPRSILNDIAAYGTLEQKRSCTLAVVDAETKDGARKLRIAATPSRVVCSGSFHDCDKYRFKSKCDYDMSLSSSKRHEMVVAVTRCLYALFEQIGQTTLKLILHETPYPDQDFTCNITVEENKIVYDLDNEMHEATNVVKAVLRGRWHFTRKRNRAAAAMGGQHDPIRELLDHYFRKGVTIEMRGDPEWWVRIRLSGGMDNALAQTNKDYHAVNESRLRSIPVPPPPPYDDGRGDPHGEERYDDITDDEDGGDSVIHP
jgi:hypothetical protein